VARASISYCAVFCLGQSGKIVTMDDERWLRKLARACMRTLRSYKRSERAGSDALQAICRGITRRLWAFRDSADPAPERRSGTI
jgi:hypothetical protein